VEHIFLTLTELILFFTSHWKSLHSNFEIFWFETFEVEAMTNMSQIQMNYLAMKQNFALEKYFPYKCFGIAIGLKHV